MSPPTYRPSYAQLTDAEVRETWHRFMRAATHSTPGSFDDGLDYEVVEEPPHEEDAPNEWDEPAQGGGG